MSRYFYDLLIKDLAAERCTMPYRPPELFNVESYCTVDERIDIWVRATVLLMRE